MQKSKTKKQCCGISSFPGGYVCQRVAGHKEIERQPIGGHGGKNRQVSWMEAFPKHFARKGPVMTEADAVREDMRSRARNLVQRWRAQSGCLTAKAYRQTCADELSAAFDLDK